MGETLQNPTESVRDIVLDAFNNPSKLVMKQVPSDDGIPGTIRLSRGDYRILFGFEWKGEWYVVGKNEYASDMVPLSKLFRQQDSTEVPEQDGKTKPITVFTKGIHLVEVLEGEGEPVYKDLDAQATDGKFFWGTPYTNDERLPKG
ncbi:MAG: hypothetical protein ABIH34_06285 [Nanoarchaeota archaeon]